jgi:DNA-directed RNA polymerase subunit RPC12/RpoP
MGQQYCVNLSCVIKRVESLKEIEMKKLYRCKVCGYILERKDAPGVCPACGVKGKIFEEYESPISQKRRKILDLHMHQIMVNLPVAFVASMSLVSFLRIIGIVREESVFMGMLKSIVFFLPFSVIFAASAGIFDGKLRFKRIATPHLKKKLALAGLFFLVSALIFVIQYFLDLSPSTYNVVVLICSAVLLSIAGALGLIGGRLIETKVRG